MSTQKKQPKKSTGRGGARPGSFIPKSKKWGHTKPYTLRVPERLVLAVDEKFNERGCDSRTEAIVQALDYWLENPDVFEIG